MAKILSFLAELFFKLLIPFGAYMAGKEAEKKDETHKALEAMRDAKDIENRLANDPAFRADVRDKYR